jgi:small subunit ribosomal protein S6e
MVEFKLVIADTKSGKCYSKEVKDEEAKSFLGLKIKDKVKGEMIDFTGYEFEITGGSDYAGFPMRNDVQGTGRKKILAVTGIGFKPYYRKRKKGIRRFQGTRQRKTVCGNTIFNKTAQINLKVVTYGRKPIGGEAEAKPAEEKGKTESAEE